MIRLDQAHQINRGTRTDNGKPIIVAVLDTGIDLSHPAFANRLVPGYDFVGNDNDPSEEGILWQGSFGHGTHVSGIVALTAPEAKIMPIRVLNSNGEGELWKVQRAIIWALDNGADVINMSFSFPEDVLPQDIGVLKKLMDYCDDGVELGGKTYPETANRRCIMVAGSGNGGNSARVYPAALKAESVEIMSVAANTRYDRLAVFYSINVAGSGGDEWVRFVAPGENIISAIPGGRYGSWSGTSMAAPIVAGIAALVKAKEPSLNTEQVFDRVENTGIGWACRLASRNYDIDTSRVDAYCALTNNLACGVPRTGTCPE